PHAPGTLPPPTSRGRVVLTGSARLVEARWRVAFVALEASRGTGSRARLPPPTWPSSGALPLLHDHVVQQVGLVARELAGEVEPYAQVVDVRQDGVELVLRRDGADRLLTSELAPGARHERRAQLHPLAGLEVLDRELDVYAPHRPGHPQTDGVGEGPGVGPHPEADALGRPPVARELGRRYRVLPVRALVHDDQVARRLPVRRLGLGRGPSARGAIAPRLDRLEPRRRRWRTRGLRAGRQRH